MHGIRLITDDIWVSFMGRQTVLTPATVFAREPHISCAACNNLHLP